MLSYGFLVRCSPSKTKVLDDSFLWLTKKGKRGRGWFLLSFFVWQKALFNKHNACSSYFIFLSWKPSTVLCIIFPYWLRVLWISAFCKFWCFTELLILFNISLLRYLCYTLLDWSSSFAVNSLVLTSVTDVVRLKYLMSCYFSPLPFQL